VGHKYGPRCLKVNKMYANKWCTQALQSLIGVKKHPAHLWQSPCLRAVIHSVLWLAVTAHQCVSLWHPSNHHNKSSAACFQHSHIHTNSAALYTIDIDVYWQQSTFDPTSHLISPALHSPLLHLRSSCYLRATDAGTDRASLISHSPLPAGNTATLHCGCKWI